eukprot:gb/GECG01015163.1/.p1 GENE.gb/GECG01015163.1/~~gb/GECG01015163.1/.p1  ORF type:complete len:946 (+),score=110.03 gb/GECG01015163.1/:1-2838(+)
MNRIVYRRCRGGLSSGRIFKELYGSYYWTRRSIPLFGSPSYLSFSKKTSQHTEADRKGGEADYKYLLEFLKPAAKEKVLNRHKRRSASSQEAVARASGSSSGSCTQGQAAEEIANETTDELNSEEVYDKKYRPISSLEAKFLHQSDSVVVERRLGQMKQELGYKLAQGRYGYSKNEWKEAVAFFRERLYSGPEDLFSSNQAFQAFLARCNLSERSTKREHVSDLVDLCHHAVCNSEAPTFEEEQDMEPDSRAISTHIVDYRPSSTLAKEKFEDSVKDIVTPEDQTVLSNRIKPLYDYTPAMEVAAEQAGLSTQLWIRSVARLRRALMANPSIIFDGVTVDTDVIEGVKKVPTERERDFRRRVDYTEAQHAFERFLHRCNITNSAYEDAHLKDMTQLVVRAAQVYFPDDINLLHNMRRGADLRLPHQWYTIARSMKRQIIYHAGPTNSGKTYNALQRLRAADKGVYAGPLRLLALEIYERLNMEGTYTSLLTGQERRRMPFSSHTACTVEMLNLNDPLDVAVIDEIQLIGDSFRGHAWTRAVMGAPAKEIHVCGDPSAIPALEKLCDISGDDFHVRTYERLSPLKVCDESIQGDYSNIRAGDAVVAFSRRDIYAIRRNIEQSTSHKCCVVYGNLPPETRSSQAQLFNDPNSGYDVLVASDAIGMGLNLNIRRVIFHTLEKYDGTGVNPVSPAQVKQIGGRAGRHGTQYSTGEVTTFLDDDIEYLQDCMNSETHTLTRAGLFPSSEQLEAFARVMPEGTNTPLSKLLENFVDVSQMDGDYFMCRHDDAVSAAKILDEIKGLKLSEKYTLCCAPAQLKNGEVRVAFERYARTLAERKVQMMDIQLPIRYKISGLRDMELLEGRHQAIDLYLWLSYRFPMHFPQRSQATSMKSEAINMIESGLINISTSLWQQQRRKKRKPVSERSPPKHLRRNTNGKQQEAGKKKMYQ